MLVQRQWPHIYPKHVGTIPMYMYGAYERLSVQRTTKLNYMTPPRRKDGNSDDLDSPPEAHVRGQIMKERVHYPYFKALALIDNVNTHNLADRHLQAAKESPAAITAERMAAAFGGRPWGGSGSQTKAPSGPVAIKARSALGRATAIQEC